MAQGRQHMTEKQIRLANLTDSDVIVAVSAHLETLHKIRKAETDKAKLEPILKRIGRLSREKSRIERRIANRLQGPKVKTDEDIDALLD